MAGDDKKRRGENASSRSATKRMKNKLTNAEYTRNKKLDPMLSLGLSLMGIGVLLLTLVFVQTAYDGGNVNEIIAMAIPAQFDLLGTTVPLRVVPKVLIAFGGILMIASIVKTCVFKVPCALEIRRRVLLVAITKNSVIKGNDEYQPKQVKVYSRPFRGYALIASDYFYPADLLCGHSKQLGCLDVIDCCDGCEHVALAFTKRGKRYIMGGGRDWRVRHV